MEKKKSAKFPLPGVPQLGVRFMSLKKTSGREISCKVKDWKIVGKNKWNEPLLKDHKCEPHF
jgi:hypothetical protein